MRGVFIAIDGIDGCGKGTIIQKLVRELPKEKTFVTREPFNRTRMKEFFSKPNAIQRKEEALTMYTEDREHHCTVMQAHLEAGNIIICDRYKYATYAYQTAQGLPFELVHESQKKFMAPDVAIIIDIPASESMKRMQKDAQRRQLFEFEQEAFLGKVRENFLKLPGALKENIVIVDGNKSPDEVYAAVKQEAMRVLQKIL